MCGINLGFQGSTENVSSIFEGHICRTQTFPVLVPRSAWLGNAASGLLWPV